MQVEHTQHYEHYRIYVHLFIYDKKIITFIHKI